MTEYMQESLVKFGGCTSWGGGGESGEGDGSGYEMRSRNGLIDK